MAARVKLLRPNQLTSSDISRWRNLCRGGQFDSPFFHPIYTLTVAQVRQDVEIAKVESSEMITGYFPFHRCPGDVGRPVGMKLTDCQGIVGGLPEETDARSFLSECHLTAWHFDHLPSSQCLFARFAYARADSPYLDLSHGWEHYRSQKRRQRSYLIPTMQRKERKIEREVGALRFVAHCEETEIFRQLVAWKSEQRRRTGSFDALRLDWVIEVLNRLRRVQTDDFAGVLSALFAGDHLIAAHLGLRTNRVFHFWFSGYDPEFAKYSPGLLLILKMAESAATRGIGRFELGKGREPFKTRLASGVMHVYEGSADCNRLRNMFDRGWHYARCCIRSTPLRLTLLSPKRLLDGWVME